jgi:hypothetical protein
MTPDQRARASAALDAWYADGSPSGFPGRSRAWHQFELESMHAAPEAPDTGAALEAFCGPRTRRYRRLSRTPRTGS